MTDQFAFVFVVKADGFSQPKILSCPFKIHIPDYIFHKTEIIPSKEQIIRYLKEKVENPIAVSSHSIIDHQTNKQLINLVQSLQKSKNDIGSILFSESDDLQRFEDASTIFEIKNRKLLTEINGLQYLMNIKLYNIIENILSKFIESLFRKCLPFTFCKQYDSLSFFIRIKQINELQNWYQEKKEVVAIGNYYFHLDGMNKTEIKLQIGVKECGNRIQELEIDGNGCIVFRNKINIKHRHILSNNTSNCFVLSFLLLNPEEKQLKLDELHWVNYKWKLDVIIKNIVCKLHIKMLPKDIILLIELYSFGEHKNISIITNLEEEPNTQIVPFPELEQQIPMNFLGSTYFG
eukprot:310368_1